MVITTIGNDHCGITKKPHTGRVTIYVFLAPAAPPAGFHQPTGGGGGLARGLATMKAPRSIGQLSRFAQPLIINETIDHCYGQTDRSQALPNLLLDVLFGFSTVKTNNNFIRVA